MDQEPPRLKHQGGWLAAAIHTLESELPSEDQLERLQANACSGLDPDELGSGVREKLLAGAATIAGERVKLRRSARVKRPAPKPPAIERSEPRAQPSWRTVVFAAAAGALLTLAVSSAWRGVPRPASPGDASTASAVTPPAPILREFVEWQAPASATGHASAPFRASAPDRASASGSPDSASTPPPLVRGPRVIPSVTLESALGPALPEDWETPDARDQRLAYRNGDLWWLHPEAAGGGRLKLNSNPISRVSVDGTVLGLTPIVDAWVPAGKHTVTFDHSIFGRKRRVVEVTSGATKVVAVWFGNEPQRP